VIRAIPKHLSADKQSAKAWRPISLLSVTGKVLESLMINRVNYHLKKSCLQSKLQFGFRPLRSTVDTIRRVTNRMVEIRNSKKVGVVVSLDVAGAFDNAWWPAILKRLKSANIPHNLWHLCENYFDGRTAELEVAGSTATKRATKGCPQGSTCGPGFCNCLYDEVLQLELPVECELTAFADDLLMVAWTNDEHSLSTKVNTALKQITTWGKAVKLKFNPTKTQMIIISRRRQTPVVRVKMEGQDLETVQVIKYLGVYLDRKLKWNAHLRNVCMKADRLLSRIASVSRNCWGLNSEAIEAVYRGAIEPMVLYAAEIWYPALEYKWAKHMLNRIQRGALI